MPPPLLTITKEKSMGTINKTLLEVTTRIFNSVYRKTFEVKEHVWSEDQGICIDLCSIYTNLEDWSEFIDKHGKHGWSIADLDDYFGIEVAETHWEKEDQNGYTSYVHVEDIVNVKEAYWKDKGAALERAELLAQRNKYPGEEQLYAE